MTDRRDPATAQWRWNDLPDYKALTAEILEARLRDKFGNYKFYVTVSTGIGTGASRCGQENLTLANSAEHKHGCFGSPGISQR